MRFLVQCPRCLLGYDLRPGRKHCSCGAKFSVDESGNVTLISPAAPQSLPPIPQYSAPTEGVSSNELPSLGTEQNKKKKKIVSGCDVTSDLILQLLSEEQSFEIDCKDAREMEKIIGILESEIESLGYFCRVYTAWRSVFVFLVVAACWIPTLLKIMVWPALASLLIVGLHNWWTYNPDYEICKHLVSIKLSVKKRKAEFVKGKRTDRWYCFKAIIWRMLLGMTFGPIAIILCDEHKSKKTECKYR